MVQAIEKPDADEYHMTQTVLLMDIGGSNTRGKIIDPEQEVFTDVECNVTRTAKISSRTDLLVFINTLLSDHELKDRLCLAVLCFVAPVTSHSRVTLTTWVGTRDIAFDDLVQCDLPTEATLLINDMEAAAGKA
jgi:glucokinase